MRGGTEERPAGGSDGGEPEFPVAELERLEKMVSRVNWVIPVLPGGELEVLLKAAIDLCKRGLDDRSEPCQRFFRDGLTTSITRLLNGNLVSSDWKKFEQDISNTCERLIALCVAKLQDDCFFLLDLLAMVFDPQNTFHTVNKSRAPKSVSPDGGSGDGPEESLFARPADPCEPRGWLVHLINRFGQLGGFRRLLERFESGRALTPNTVHALLRPVGLCHEMLTVHTIEKYMLPIVEIVPAALEKLSDDELKKEASDDGGTVSSIVKMLKDLAGRAPGQEHTVNSLEMFRLRMRFRLLQISSFAEMLDEVSRVISSMAACSHGRGDEECLTAGKMALSPAQEWIQKTHVLHIVLRNSLQQPQYMEKLEEIIRFIIKEKALTLEDLDSLWAAQSGKHEAIVTGVHDLLARFAGDLSAEQLDHLLGRLQASWASGTRQEQERLLELIRRLAEGDKDGVLARRVLSLLWSLALLDDVPTEAMDQALSTHVQILDRMCSQDRDEQKMEWLDQCVEELNSDMWVLPALKQIREICCLYDEAPSSCSDTQSDSSQHGSRRHEIISQLQLRHSLVAIVTENLTNYVQRMRTLAFTSSDIDVNTYCPDGRYSHVQQIEERLNFLRFLLKEGQLWLCAPQAHQIWSCLVKRAAFPADREVCFKWFSKLMGDAPDLDPNINQEFFERNIVQLDPALLTESGIKCFDKFFRAVNQKAGKLDVSARGTSLMEDEELIGLDYIWRVVTNAGDEIANKAIELLLEIYTNLGPQLQTRQKSIRGKFISNCMDRLRASYDTLLVLERERDVSPARQRVATTLCRVLKVLREYIVVCDEQYGDERVFLPMFRAHRGKPVSLVIRLPAQGRGHDLTVQSHTWETLAAVRRRILRQLKTSPQESRLELDVNGETLDQAEDRKCIGDIAVIRDGTVLTATVRSVGVPDTTAGDGVMVSSTDSGLDMASSPDTSSDSSLPSTQHPGDAANVEAESQLPGVILSQQEKYVEFLLRLSDLGCRVEHAPLRDAAHSVLQVAPAGRSTVDKLRAACQGDTPVCTLQDVLFFSASPAQFLYSLEVLYVLLTPADGPLSDQCSDFHRQFVKSGCGVVVLDMVNKKSFLPGADLATRRLAYLTVLRLSKVVLPAAMTGKTGDTALQQDASVILLPSHIWSMMKLAWAASCEQLQAADRQSAELRQLLQQAADRQPAELRQLLQQAADRAGPTTATATTADAGEQLHDLDVCREALKTIAMALCLRRDILEAFTGNAYFQDFIVDLLLICPNRAVRVCAAEQFSRIATRRTDNSSGLVFFINLLSSRLNDTVKENASTSQEYFQLLCRLLNHACRHDVPVPGLDKLLHAEVTWLHQVKERQREPAVTDPVDDVLMEGHTRVTRELLSFILPEHAGPAARCPSAPAPAPCVSAAWSAREHVACACSAHGATAGRPRRCTSSVCAGASPRRADPAPCRLRPAGDPAADQ